MLPQTKHTPLRHTIIPLTISLWSLILLMVWVGHYVPRGSQLSYISRPDSVAGASAVNVMLYDTRHGLRVPILHMPREPQQLSWSPDGRYLAFYPSPSPEELNIYQPETQDLTSIPLDNILLGGLLLPATGSNGRMSWSSDGKKLTFITHDCCSAYTDAIHILDIENLHIITVVEGYGSISNVAWSPIDADVFAFWSHGSRGVYLYDTEAPHEGAKWLTRGGNYTWIPDGSGVIVYHTTGKVTVHKFNQSEVIIPVSVVSEHNLTWEPNGRSFLYSAAQNTSFDVLQYDLNTGLTSTLAGWRTYEGQPAWSHDGRWIAYVATLNGHDNVMLYDTQRDARFRLLQLTARDWNPVWRAPSQ